MQTWDKVEVEPLESPSAHKAYGGTAAPGV